MTSGRLSDESVISVVITDATDVLAVLAAVLSGLGRLFDAVMDVRVIMTAIDMSKFACAAAAWLNGGQQSVINLCTSRGGRCTQ